MRLQYLGVEVVPGCLELLESHAPVRVGPVNQHIESQVRLGGEEKSVEDLGHFIGDPARGHAFDQVVGALGEELPAGQGIEHAGRGPQDLHEIGRHVNRQGPGIVAHAVDGHEEALVRDVPVVGFDGFTVCGDGLVFLQGPARLGDAQALVIFSLDLLKRFQRLFQARQRLVVIHRLAP